MQLLHIIGEAELHVAQFDWHPHVPFGNGYLFDGHVATQ
jgi:hypothetical protein